MTAPESFPWDDDGVVDAEIVDAEIVVDVPGQMVTASLAQQIGFDARTAVLDWTDPDVAAAAAQQTRLEILQQVRLLYATTRLARQPGKTATTGRVTGAQVAPELGFLAAADYALTAFSDAVRAGAEEARGIAGGVVLEVEPDREVGTASVKVGTAHGTVKATRTQATKASVDVAAIIDVLVADQLGTLETNGVPPELVAASAAGARAALATLLGLISPPAFKSTALDDWQRRLEGRGEDALALRLGHAYGRVAYGEAKTKLTVEPTKAAKA